MEKTVFTSTKTKTILLPQFLKSPTSSFVPETSSYHPQEQVILDAGWMSQLPRNQHDQLVNCAIVAEMHNCLSDLIFVGTVGPAVL